MEVELQKMEIKNEFKDAKLGRNPFFIDTLNKSWPSNSKRFGRLGLRHVSTVHGLITWFE